MSDESHIERPNERVLFVNACVRGGQSRTLRLARALLKRLEGEICEVDLAAEEITPLKCGDIDERARLAESGDRASPLVRYARDFAAADTVLVAAPYWDMSFPAVLKTYFENVCVNGITFRYSEQGVPVGLCRARKLWYVTTSGGPIGGYNLGYDYLSALCSVYFGITETQCVCAENLDVWGSDPEKIISDAIAEVKKLNI